MKARINNVTIGYDDFGSGPAVLLLHGLPLNRSMWHSQVKPLVEAGYRVILPDLRGFGDSLKRNDSWDIVHMAEDVVALLKYLGIGRAVIGGIDLGGCVLLNLIDRFPSKVVAAIFVGISARAADLKEKEQSDDFIRRLNEGQRRSVLGSFQILLTSEKGQPEVAARVGQLIEDVDDQALENGIKAMKNRKDYTVRIRSFTLPSLAIGAEEDHFVKTEHTRFMGAALPNGNGLILSDAGHLANLEKAGEFNRCLLDFLSGLTASRPRTESLRQVA